LLRRVLSCTTAASAYELIAQQQTQQHYVVSTDDVDLLLRCSLEAGSVDLALSVYQQLRAAQLAQAAFGAAAPASTWPAATLQHTDTVVKGLCRQLRVNDALAVLRSIRAQGVPGSDEVRHSGISQCFPQQSGRSCRFGKCVTVVAGPRGMHVACHS
jgi:pentatricopeptide repeat protein